MAEETIGRTTVELGADGSKLAPEMAAAIAKAQGELDRANRKMERAHASTMKAIQGHIDKINATRPTQEMRLLEQAVLKLGGSANLTKGQLARVTLEVNALAAAGAKVPATLSNLTGMGSKMGAAFTALTTGRGISGALMAIGPAGVAAAGALGVVTVAGTAAVRQIAALASKAEQWSNMATRTGLGIVPVQQLTALLEDAGIPAETLTAALKGLHSEIADGGKNLKKYGIDLASIKDLTPEEQLQAVAQALLNISDVNVRGAAAQDVFKKGGEALIPVLDAIATSGYKVIDALGEKQVAALTKTDEALDRLSRSWSATWRGMLGGAVEFADAYNAKLLSLFGVSGQSPVTESLADFNKRMARIAPDARGLELGTPTPEQLAAAKAYGDELEKQNRVLEKRKQELEEIGRLFRNEKGLVDSYRTATSVTMKSLLGLPTGPATTFTPTGTTVTAKPGGLMGSLMGTGIATSLNVGYFKQLEMEAKAKEEATKRTQRLVQTFDTLSNQLSNLALTTGGFTGKLLGMLSAMSSGAGGIVSGVAGWRKASAQKGILGSLGKLSAGLGIAGSIIGGISGLIGGIKSLFGGKSKEQKEAERQAAREAAEAKKEAERQAKIDRDRNLREGLGSAKGFAESLMARLDEGGLSEGLTSALQTLIGKVGDAVFKAGLGILDPRLKASTGFGAAQGLAGDVAGVMSGMRQAGIFDAGLMAAGGTAAGEIQRQAIEAAKAAGLSDQEAQRAGSAAIAGLLREQLNYSVQSGKELDANTKALLEEAKANGIEILADPALEHLEVAKQQLGVLRDIAGRAGSESGRGPFGKSAARGLGPLITKDVGGGFGPLIQTHPEELIWVVPRSKVLSAAKGLYDDRSREGGEGRNREPGEGPLGGGTGGAEGPGGVFGGAGLPTMTAAALERAMAVAVERVARPITIAPVIQINEDPEGDKETRDRRRQSTVRDVARAFDERIPILMISAKRALSEGP